MTDYLLDTNIVSETSKHRPEPRVRSFLLSVAREQLYVSALTIGELQRGVVLVRNENPTTAANISAWIAQTERDFAGRILDVDAQVAKAWAEVSIGPTKPTLDLLIAATAIRHGMTLVTRNVRHVTGLGLSIVNPWDDR